MRVCLQALVRALDASGVSDSLDIQVQHPHLLVAYNASTFETVSLFYPFVPFLLFPAPEAVAHTHPPPPPPFSLFALIATL